jgi:hypothetical protein
MSPAEEAHEQAEHAEEARHPFDKRVAATMAGIAALLAIVSVLGHIATTEELINQQKASDQWSFYQAKSIRRFESEIARDVFAALKSEKTADYTAKAESYRKDSDGIQEKAEELVKESELRGRQALRLHFGEVFLEIAIVLASLAILTKRRVLWFSSIGGALLGVLIAGTTYVVK